MYILKENSAVNRRARFQDVATNNSVNQAPDPPWCGITFTSLLCLVFGECRVFPFVHAYSQGYLTAAFSHWWLHQCSFLYFRKRLYLNSWDSLQFPVENEAHPNLACFPRAMITCLDSANHLLSGSKTRLCLPLPISLVANPLVNDFPNYIIVVDTIMLCPDLLLGVDIAAMDWIVSPNEYAEALTSNTIVFEREASGK